MTRFAGEGLESYFNKNRPDFGAMSSAGDTMRSRTQQAATGLAGEVGAQGISAAGEVEAAGIIADAQGQVAQAQGQASMMEGIGGIASSAIGAFGGGGGGSTSWGNMSTGQKATTMHNFGNTMASWV